MRRITIKATLVYFLLTGITFLSMYYVTVNYDLGSYYWSVMFFIYLIGLIAFSLWIEYRANLILQLKEMATSFSRGNLIPSVYITNDDEIGELNDALHDMANNLNSYLQKTLQERDQIETILASMVEGVLAFDSAGRLMLINKTAEDMIGTTWEESGNHYFLEVLRNHQLADLLKKGLTNSSRQVIELKLSPMASEYYRVYITPIIAKNGKSQGAIMVLRNVTKVRLLEQMRSDFVANVSHELRTPLTSIKGYVETLLDGSLENPEVLKRFLTIINDEAERLNRLISDLLYLSQLETGKMEVAKTTIQSQSFMQKITTILKPLAESKGIEFPVFVHQDAQTFQGNESMMEQVMINLLENAIKYSPSGEKVEVNILPHEQGTVIKIIDKGIGIPAESLPRLFERFYRVDKARSRELGGTGLGLSIVKHIVDRHRGHVQVESEEDIGTTFFVILPKD